MQNLSVIKDFSFFGLPDSEQVFKCLIQNQDFKGFFIPNYKDFQTIAPFYIL